MKYTYQIEARIKQLEKSGQLNDARVLNNIIENNIILVDLVKLCHMAIDSHKYDMVRLYLWCMED